MSGGSYEYTAAYVNNGKGYGRESIYNGDAKTKDVYIVATEDSGKENYEANSKKYGDAVYEVSGYVNGDGAWYRDMAIFPDATNSSSFFRRGDFYANTQGAGIFSFTDGNGFGGANTGFRPVLIVM